ncbi:hypothetical protein GCM10027422_28780 [Hymenobacter arcticus]
MVATIKVIDQIDSKQKATGRSLGSSPDDGINRVRAVYPSSSACKPLDIIRILSVCGGSDQAQLVEVVGYFRRRHVRVIVGAYA